MGGAVWVPVPCSPLLVAVWSCLVAAKRDDRVLSVQEADEAKR